METCETFTADTSETTACSQTPIDRAKARFSYTAAIIATIIQFMIHVAKPDKVKYNNEILRASKYVTTLPDDEHKLNRMLSWDTRNIVCHVINSIENEFNADNCGELALYEKATLPFINKEWVGRDSFIDRLVDVMNIITDGINRNFSNYNPNYTKIADIWGRMEVYKTVIDKLDPKSGKLIVGLIESSKSIDLGWTRYLTND